MDFSCISWKLTSITLCVLLSISIIISIRGSKPPLLYSKHMETSKLRAIDARPPVTLAAAPVYIGEDDGLGLDLDSDEVTELEADDGPGFALPDAGGAMGLASDDGVITGTAGVGEVTAATDGVVEAVAVGTVSVSVPVYTVVVVAGACTKPPESGDTA